MERVIHKKKWNSKRIAVITGKIAVARLISYQNRRTSVLFLYTILVFILTSCVIHPYSWQGSNPPGKNKASFKDFRGKNINSIEVPKGNMLLVSYSIEVKQGTLLLSVEQNKNKLWQKEFSNRTDSAEFQLPAAKTGVYKIVVEGKNATGSFDVNYKTVTPKYQEGK